jgi:hypothetical protein
VRSTAEVAQRVAADALCIPPQLHVHDLVLQHLGWALVAELETGPQNNRLFADSIGSAIATHLLMRYSMARSVTAPRGLTRRQLQSVTDFINENLSENLSLSELAAVAGAGVSHFKALFKRTTGLPVHQYVIRRWVDFAIKLYPKMSGVGRAATISRRPLRSLRSMRRSPKGIRIPVSALRGRRPRPLDDGAGETPGEGFEPPIS